MATLAELAVTPLTALEPSTVDAAIGRILPGAGQPVPVASFGSAI